MTPRTCMDIRADLAAWSDDALVGARRQAVSSHVEACAACTERVAEWQALGELLRRSRPMGASHEALAGLAGQVVARLGAEERASWRGVTARAFDGWHWAIVASGALVATVVNTSMLAAILSFGPKPAAEDSLSAVMTNMSAPAGYVFAFVSPEGQGQATAVWQVANGLPSAPSFVAALAAPAPPEGVSEVELVQQLAEVVAPKGEAAPLAALSPARRALAEALLDEIGRLRLQDHAVTDTRRTVRVHAVRLVTSVTVKL